MSEIHTTKILIIGSGAAGYTAAIYTARTGLHPVVITGMQPGGQLTVSSEVENFPGFPEKVTGSFLMEQMQKQAENMGAALINDMVSSVDFSTPPFTCKTENGKEYQADIVIIATGASAKWLGIPSEEKFKGFGVSACATCDGFFYKGKNICVVGGGNTAVEEALFLSTIASHVTLIHRKDTLRAEKVMQDRLFKKENIHILWNTEVDEFLGSDNPPNLTGIRIKDSVTGEKKELQTDGVFVAIGHAPNTDLFKDQIELDKGNYIVTKPNSTATNIPGVFAAGDVQDHVFRQAVTAAGTGCMAALEAQRFLEAKE